MEVLKSLIEFLRGLFGMLVMLLSIVWGFAGVPLLVIGFFDPTWVTWTLSYFPPWILLFIVGLGGSMILADIAKRIVPREWRTDFS